MKGFDGLLKPGLAAVAGMLPGGGMGLLVDNLMFWIAVGGVFGLAMGDSVAMLLANRCNPVYRSTEEPEGVSSRQR